ncbi:DUF1294 domain-containing protein [Microbulbifer celer]|uniref:DUF1294 domain-containing protein n=1 Tax=Microbulbifer celer TaxID=435905 RepID=A0ABW3U643_9GAMM|nr:DUF1294 domain-containing protein [Microbulbifer celer]UFN56725.1 DUF1294 domain-containing protein [Microbulbifer celer]
MFSVFFLPLVFFLLLGTGTLFHWLPTATFPYFVGISLVTFIAYYLDKSAARQGSRRIRENTLHVLSLAGGWPGALIARHQFRHKTRKQPFRLVFWLTVMGNIALLVWALTTDGLYYLQNLITSYL